MDKKLKDIIGNLIIYTDDTLPKTDLGVYLYLPKTIEKGKLDWYSFDEIKEFIIIEEVLTTHVERYISKVYSCFEYGNINGRLDLEVIFSSEFPLADDKPILAVLIEADSEIKKGIIKIKEDGVEDVSFDLLKLQYSKYE